MRRREFIAGLGSAAAWPAVARAQQGERVRRIGYLTGGRADDPVTRSFVTAFVQALQQLGWTVGRNARLEERYTSRNRDLERKYAEELVAETPDVILAVGAESLGPLQQATRTIPIVFVTTADPVGGGFVRSLRGLAATLQDFFYLNTAWSGNGRNCSSRSHRP
jgi:putative tryptophan/tyrosine transport system substrate-binding protein